MKNVNFFFLGAVISILSGFAKPALAAGPVLCASTYQACMQQAVIISNECQVVCQSQGSQCLVSCMNRMDGDSKSCKQKFDACLKGNS